MADTIKYEGSDQGKIAEAGARIALTRADSLPRVPLLSNSGQQNAFREILNIISEEANRVDAEQDAKNAIIFWAMTVLYANSKPFRLATASVKNFGIAPSSVASSFISWVGTDTHPGVVVMQDIDKW